jgi:hypothetical protein
MIQSVAIITIGSPPPRVDAKPTLAERGFEKNLAQSKPRRIAANIKLPELLRNN